MSLSLPMGEDKHLVRSPSLAWVSCPDMPGRLPVQVMLLTPIAHKYFQSIGVASTSDTIGPIFQISQSGMNEKGSAWCRPCTGGVLVISILEMTTLHCSGILENLALAPWATAHAPDSTRHLAGLFFIDLKLLEVSARKTPLKFDF